MSAALNVDRADCAQWTEEPWSMMALTIKEPWAWLIIHGGKDIENRGWPCSYRGRIAIHASGKAVPKWEYRDVVRFVREFDPALADRIPAYSDLVLGAVIGTVTLADCVKHSPSPWFQGDYGFVLEDPSALTVPTPAKGKLGLWRWNP